MRYEITSKTITFLLENPKTTTPSKVCFSRGSTGLSESALARICTAIVRQLEGKRATTQRNYLSNMLRPILSYFQTQGSNFPITSDEGQMFLLNFFQYYLTDETWSKASASTRMSYWSTQACGVFEFWMEEELLPCDMQIPTIRLKQVKSAAVNQRLLGDREATSTAVPIASKKILVDVAFAATASDYLESVERACREKINTIKQVCLSHWEALMADGHAGTQLSANVSHTELVELQNAGRCSQQIRGGSLTPLASHAHPEGHAWALAITRHLLLEGNHRDCVSLQALIASQFFALKTFKAKGFKIFEQYTAMPLPAFNQLSTHARYCRFAGFLSTIDAAAACCLLIIEHPEFTSDALQNARLLNSKGKPHLLLSDNGQSSILSLDKPRAGSRKSVALTPVSQKLIKDIVAWTAPVREVLKRAGDKDWRYLFLGVGRGGRLGALSPTARHLNNSKNANSLVCLYPNLVEQGLGEGLFDYRRIRTTMGVLRWFETGSIQEMSRRLGNSTRVVLEHYLPPALLSAWNARIIRRFQNTLIVLAAYGEDYLLDVADFTSVADLQHFIAQLVLEYPGNSSPLAKELQSRFATTSQSGDKEVAVSLGEGVLNIRLSVTSLSYLYAFSDFALSTMTSQELNQADGQSKLAPMQFVNLAQLIRHVSENDSTLTELREALDVPRLRLMHERATAQCATLTSKFSQLSIGYQWEAQNA